MLVSFPRTRAGRAIVGFLRTESAGGILLMGAAILALMAAVISRR
jgi:Na+/H+ antiporter NhaA